MGAALVALAGLVRFPMDIVGGWGRLPSPLIGEHAVAGGMAVAARPGPGNETLIQGASSTVAVHPTSLAPWAQPTTPIPERSTFAYLAPATIAVHPNCGRCGSRPVCTCGLPDVDPNDGFCSRCDHWVATSLAS